MTSYLLDRWKQTPRIPMPRGLLAILFPLLYAFSLFIYYRLGVINSTALIAGSALVLFFILLFFSAFRLNVNIHFHDPNLTVHIINAAASTLLVVAYLDSSSRILFEPFMLIAFLFGVSRLPIRALILSAAGWFTAYLLMILLRGYMQSYPPNFHHDLMQGFMLGLTLICVIVIGGQMRYLRKKLELTHSQLEHYEEKSIRDELTGAYNRRQILIELQQAAFNANHPNIANISNNKNILTPSVPAPATAITASTSYCICIIDIDHFKVINDKSGHSAGDFILREFASVAQQSIRNNDIFGRYGGDEFIYILPDTKLKGAIMHAERLRVRTSFLDFHKILPQKSISLSIGVAQYRKGEEITDLIERADNALYRAKKFGRNRVEWEE